MSVKPTCINVEFFGSILSVEGFVLNALGSEKIPAKEGFKNLSDNGWNYCDHYLHIKNGYPSESPVEAIEEMSELIQLYKNQILQDAKRIDEAIMRIEKMEQEMANIISRE